MGLSFFEVMRGNLDDLWGRPHPIAFEVRAESTELSDFAVRGRARISGIVQCAPWADHAPLVGELLISPLRARQIAYDFTFRGPDETSYRFRGKKELRWRRPLRSLTRLSGELQRDDATIASGELFFDKGQISEFLGSMRNTTSIRRRRWVNATHDDALLRALGEKERETFAALLEACIERSARVPAADDTTLAAASQVLLSWPSTMIASYRQLLRLLDGWARLERGRRFAALASAERRALIERFHSTSTVSARQLLTFPIKSGHFGRKDFLAAIEHPPWPQIAKEPPLRHMRQVRAPEQLQAETRVEAEVVIVGSGAGGAALAAELARRGVAVALIEEGRIAARHDFGGAPIDRMRALYRSGGATISLGTPIAIPHARAVGGTTVINSGTCFPTPEGVLRQWRDGLGFPADFEPERYAKYSQQVAEALQVQPASLEAVGAIARVIGRGADALGLAHGPLPRNAPECPGAGQCIFGCPEGAKRSAEIAFLPKALAAGAELYVGLPMTRILKRGRRVVAMETEGNDAHGAPRRVRFFADRFVLACGSLRTPLVLAENGFSNPRIGQNLSVHPAIGLVARCQEPLDAWRAIPQGYALHALQEEGIRYEGYYLPPAFLAPQLPWIGAELNRWMEDFSKLAQFGFMVRDRSVGRVRRGASGRPLITYRLTEDAQRRLKLGSSLLAELFLLAGASEVFAPINAGQRVRTRAEAHALRDLKTHFASFRLLGAHPLGTCAMGKDPERAVVDFDYRVFGADNLHVVDGSVVPTSLGANPQMTIMAFALRAAEILEGLIAAGA